MNEIKKKICLVGDFSVGKTSLTQQFVNQVFSERYLTTIGVKIDTKIISQESGTVKLVIWDVAGRDSLSPLNANYLIGAAGYILVVDGTRRETISSANMLVETVHKKLPDVPFIVLVNKSDMADKWLFTDADMSKYEGFGWHVLKTSAKTGENVENAFLYLAGKLL